MRALLKIEADIPDGISPGDETKFVYHYDKAHLIFPLEDWEMAFETDKKKLAEHNTRMKYYRENYISDKKLSRKFDGREMTGIFHSRSRIDRIPIFDVDISISQLRDDKINEILK